MNEQAGVEERLAGRPRADAHEDARAKARILTEALPYIRRWNGKTMVVKVGGETLEDAAHLESFAEDVTLLKYVGVNPVIVHGGGPQISERMRAAGREPAFTGGLRVTDAATMSIVRSVLLDEINARLVAALNEHGSQGAGLAGDAEALISVDKRWGPGGEDLGFVGRVSTVNPASITKLIAGGHVPVVAPLGAGPGGSYNVNADQVAGAIASALRAQKIVFLTNVPGLYADLGDEGSLISEIDVEQCERLLGDEALSAGMVPKISAVVDAIRGGVPHAHILDGRLKHALLLEVFTVEGVGTMITPSLNGSPDGSHGDQAE